MLAQDAIRKVHGGYANLDDERLAGVSAQSLLAAIDRVYRDPRAVLFDEVQNLPRWELFVNRLQRGGRKVLVVGSNANLLSRELATHLTGRHHAVTLLPFSFREMLRARADEPSPAERRELLLDYLEHGGYPEPLLHGVNRTEYLRDLVRATLQKDIVRRYNLRKTDALEKLASHLFSHSAHLLSYRNLVQAGLVSSTATAAKYVRMLEEVFLVFSVERFSFRAMERNIADRKMYVIDPGIAMTLGLRSSQDRGRMLETAVAIRLFAQAQNGGPSVHYYRNAQGEEIDFVLHEHGRVSALVQVCFEIQHQKTQDRELRSLLKAKRDTRCDRLICLHLGPRRTETVTWHEFKGTIEFRDAVEWLADEQPL